MMSLAQAAFYLLHHLFSVHGLAIRKESQVISGIFQLLAKSLQLAKRSFVKYATSKEADDSCQDIFQRAVQSLLSFLDENFRESLFNVSKDLRQEEFQVRWYVHPRRSSGGQSGREKRRDKSFQAQEEKPLGTDSHRTISKGSSDCWLLTGHIKNALYYCAQSANSIFWVLFVSSYTTAIDSITACLAHAPKKCTQSGIFQFDINATFQILEVFTLEPK